MKITEKIGAYKRDNGVTILQVNRWDEILHNEAHLQCIKIRFGLCRKNIGINS